MCRREHNMDSKFCSSRELTVLIKIMNFFGFQTADSHGILGYFVSLLISTVFIYPFCNYKKFIAVNTGGIIDKILNVCFLAKSMLNTLAIAYLLTCQKRKLRRFWRNILIFHKTTAKLKIRHEPLLLRYIFMTFTQLIISIARIFYIVHSKNSTYNVVDFIFIIGQIITLIYEAIIKLKYLMLSTLFANYLKQFDDLLKAEELGLNGNAEYLTRLLKKVADGHQQVLNLIHFLNNIVSPMFLSTFQSVFLHGIFDAYSFIAWIVFKDAIVSSVISLYNIYNAFLNVLIILLPINNCINQVKLI